MLWRAVYLYTHYEFTGHESTCSDGVAQVLRRLTPAALFRSWDWLVTPRLWGGVFLHF